MIKLHLTRADDYEGVYLQLPASPVEIGEVWSWLDGISDDVASTRIVGAISNVPNISSYIRSADINDPEQFKKLDRIAEITDSLSRIQCWLFAGALDAESVNDFDDVLSIAGRLEQYKLITNVTTDRELGVYLVEYGIMPFDESVRPYLDYARIGTEYYANHGGAYTTGGYVVRRDSTEQTRDEDRAQVFKLHLYTSHVGDTMPGPYRLTLPASEKRLAQAKAAISVTDFAEAYIVQTECLIPNLDEHIPMQCPSVEMLNELAENIEAISKVDGELLKLCAALEVERPETLQGALDIAVSLDNYEHTTVGADDYGRRRLREAGIRGLDISSEIGRFMDYNAYGKWRMEQDGVRETDFGLIRKISEPFDEQSVSGMKMEY